jgi:hypothetical protein
VPIRPALLIALIAVAPAFAADVDGRRGAGPAYGRVPHPAHGGCPPPAYVTRAPTNAPDDPTYVGSVFGLGRPSYYGTTPPPGVDDPYGRRLRAC